MKTLLKIISLILLACITLSMLFIYFCPLLNPYPKPNGKYPVGNQLLHFVDNQNKYHLNKINEFNVDVFYPSNTTTQKRFLYRPEQITAINNDVVMSLSEGNSIKKIFWNLFMPDIFTYVQPNAPFNASLNKIPVVIYLPGIGSYDMHVLYLSELASHGYIVCAIEPPYDTAVTVFPDGRHIMLDSTLKEAQQNKDRDFIYKYRDQAHVTWNKYIDMTIDHLTALNNDPASMWYQRLDLDHIGLLGHSQGGAVTLDYCQKNTRCLAGIDMDGWTKTYNTTEPLKVPFLLLIGQHGGVIDIPQIKDLANNNQNSNFKEVIVSNAYHGSFSDSILSSRWPWTYIFNNYLPNPEKTRLEISNYIVEFFNKYLKKTSEQTRPFALINLGDHPWILQAQEKIKPIIDSIIKHEILKINPNAANFPEFYCKQRHLITLFYSKQMPIELEKSVLKFFKSIPASTYPTMSPLQFSKHIKLFGKDQTELVVTIDDSEHCLPRLRKFIINSLPKQLHESLATQEHNKFDFLPHETLGRIPVQEIETLSDKDTAENIKQTILKEVSLILDNITKSNIIKPTEIFVYGNDFKPIFSQTLLYNN